MYQKQRHREGVVRCQVALSCFQRGPSAKSAVAPAGVSSVGLAAATAAGGGRGGGTWRGLGVVGESNFVGLLTATN